MKYRYVGREGDFELQNPEQISYLYFPLMNESGVMSSVTPDLAGDSKINQNAFLLPPVSCENLHNDKSSRNIWCRMNGRTLWSLTGRSAMQQAKIFSDEKEETKLEAGFMHHKITRISKELGIKAELSSLVPSSGAPVELLRVDLENLSEEEQSIQIITAIPLYGRSADNIRDHRHVTALLHRIYTTKAGVMVNPSMSFDERGHQRNEMVYGVFGGNKNERPIGFYPVVEEFIGEGGNLENPGALYKKELALTKAGQEIDGYEALGGLCFAEKMLKPGERHSYVIAMAYGTDQEELEECAEAFLDTCVFEEYWKKTKEYWQKKVNVSYRTSSEDFDQWMRWVSFQPMLRRVFGCSFLPHHDYGKGGRGWRDLWQDCLALLIMNPDGVRQMLIDNFGGVRMDGTNATIIGSRQGEFIADRNHITRVWMDHGVWPFLTVELYIRQTGDINLLLEDNSYFKDMQVCRGEEKDLLWSPEQGRFLKDQKQNCYTGSILEHLLVQHLTAFYDVGEHNHIRIRGADWNDALDMASKNGESVAFTAMYASNMEKIAELLEQLKQSGIKELSLAKELTILLGQSEEIYDNVEAKQKILKDYCHTCVHQVTGEKVRVNPEKLQEDLRKKAEWVRCHIRSTEWIDTGDGCGWFNGYYDDSKRAVEGKKESEVRMMLTSQVFAVMSETAVNEQVQKIIKAADKYLYDKSVGGYRLNTDFHEIKMDLGRMFGFAYGHKENGAVFSHMTTMYANALYSRGFSKEAYKVIHTLYSHCSDFEKSRIYPGVPEYIDAKGRGMYHYLTGAASWLLLTVITQMFGVRGEMGDLAFHPQLLAEQFDKNGEAALSMVFNGKKIKVLYRNKNKLEPGVYRIKSVTVDGKEYLSETEKAVIKKETLQDLTQDQEHLFEIELY